MHPLDTLRQAVKSYEPYLQESGELFDPVLGEPTRYGTPYHAFCQAVLAARDHTADREEHLTSAFRGLDVSLQHLLNPASLSCASAFDHATGTVITGDHRASYWAPVMRTYQLMCREGVSMAEAFAGRIAAVDVARDFAGRRLDPTAVVWLTGEWIRMELGLSRTSREVFDRWLGELLGTAILLEQGMCQEPGHPNACDLFMRLHLAELLLQGYGGRWREKLDTLMVTGLHRSLQMQLSDGSLASAHQGTGQSWTVGAELAYFARGARYFSGIDEGLAGEAWTAARRALSSFVRWQRQDEPYSPVENLLPGNYRVGYEPSTFDAHSANLAMAFLASGILDGFNGAPLGDRQKRAPTHYIEADPTHRAILHSGRYSVHVNAFPDPAYDGFGISDVTFGPNRYLHFVSAVRHAAGGALFTLGIALREGPGRSAIRPLSSDPPVPSYPMERGLSEASLRVRAQQRGALFSYELNVWIDDDGVQIEESTPGLTGYKTLLVPYLRDPGNGYQTTVRTAFTSDGAVIRFRHANELIRLRLQGAVDHVLDLPYGFSNRRGLCGLIRIDLRDPTDALRYRASIGR